MKVRCWMKSFDAVTIVTHGKTDVQGEIAWSLSLVLAEERCDGHLENSSGTADRVLERNGGGL